MPPRRRELHNGIFHELRQSGSPRACTGLPRTYVRTPSTLIVAVVNGVLCVCVCVGGGGGANNQMEG